MQTIIPNKSLEAFGLHLMVDGYDCDKAALMDIDRIYRFLEEAPNKIGMTKIMPPYVFKYSGKVPDDWGLSGFVLIAESHISVHTFPERNYISIDIFSCKDFDYNLATLYATNSFSIGRHEVNLQDRGLEFPRNVNAVEHILRKERINGCQG